MKLHKSPWYCLAPVLFTMLSIDARAVASATPPLGRQPLRVQSLDGPWRLVLDPKDIGQTQVWFKPDIFPLQASRPIEVPGSIKEIDPKYDGVFWCSRSFIPALAECRDLRYYLQFGAVAYACDVWLNGTLLGSHEGGQSPFEFGECSASVMLGTWRHHAGRFTLNSLNLLGNLGHPAADRLLLNLIAHARATVAPLQALPGGYEAELDALGIR